MERLHGAAVDDFTTVLIQGAKILDLQLPDEGVQRLRVHQRLLSKWASKMNLTSVSDPAGMAERLYLDSAVLLPHIDRKSSVHDVGSGAGFPGLVLKALRPEIEVTLTEARRKRVSFLKHAAREMGLDKGLEIRWERLGRPRRPRSEFQGERWAEVVSRAAFPPAVWMKKGAPLVGEGGRLWVMAGQPFGRDKAIVNWEKALLPEGFSIQISHTYRLPRCGKERLLVGLVRMASF